METQTLEKVLDVHPLFRGMKEQHLQTLVESATVVRFEPGDVIFEEGEPAHHFYVIRTGKVALQLVSYRVEPFTLMTLEAGDIIDGRGSFRPTAGNSPPERSMSYGQSPWTERAFVQGVTPTTILVTTS